MDVNVLELENIILTVFEVFIFYVACSLLFNKRPYRKITKYSIIFVFLVAYVYVCLYSEVLLSKVLLGLLILCIMLNLLFYNGKSFINSVLSVVMVVIIVLSFNALLDYMLLVFMKSLTNEEIYSIAMGNPENLFTIGLLSRFILLALVVFITKHKKGKVRLSYRYTISFVFVFFLTVVSSILSIIPDVSYNFLFFIIMANTILMYYILNDFVKMSETVRVKSINEERYKNELNFWHEMKEKDTVQRKMLHDYSETLLCIRGYLDEKKFDELDAFVSRLSAEYKLYSSFIKTGNSLFDILVNSKHEKAVEAGITMVCKLDNLEDISIKNEDFIYIMSNLLDNALEHSATLTSKKKEVFLGITNMQKYNTLEIIVRNPIEKEIVVKDGLIETTKKGFNHGIGLGNVRDIVEKYGGESDIYVDDGYFTYIIKI